MNLTIKDVALAMTKLSKQNIQTTTRQLNQNIKNILKPSKKAHESLKKIGVKNGRKKDQI